LKFAVFDPQGDVGELVAEVAGAGATYLFASVDRAESSLEWLLRKHAFPRKAPVVIVVIESFEGVSIALGALQALIDARIANLVVFGGVELDSLFETSQDLAARFAGLRSDLRLLYIDNLDRLREFIEDVSPDSPF
jgi:hypothetical protein